MNIKDVGIYYTQIGNLEELKDFISDFDCDISGFNGEDYTIEEALKQGFDSSIDYYIDIAQRHYNGMFDMILYIMGQVAESCEYYGKPYVDRLDGTEKFIVMLPYMV